VQEKPLNNKESGSVSDVETASSHDRIFTPDQTTTAQIVGVAILEFGIVLHSVLIGLTLAVADAEEFKVLFVVLVFHRKLLVSVVEAHAYLLSVETFEGLGIGSRLAFMSLPRKYNWVPYAGAILYGLTTPIGIAAGLGARTSYNPGSTTSSAVNGFLYSISSGILLYTGLVEVCHLALWLGVFQCSRKSHLQLLAHDFLFSKEMLGASNRRLAFAICSMLLGAALMSLLGKWA
jgi:solute carrier family 39 (zinc transporter), member 1/2/3